MAAVLFLSERAVEKHINVLFAKLGIGAQLNRRQRVELVQQRRLRANRDQHLHLRECFGGKEFQAGDTTKAMTDDHDLLIAKVANRSLDERPDRAAADKVHQDIASGRSDRIGNRRPPTLQGLLNPIFSATENKNLPMARSEPPSAATMAATSSSR